MKYIWKKLRLWALALVLLPSLFATAPAAAATFLFVPIDDRPVCLDTGDVPFLSGFMKICYN